MSRRWK